MRIGHKALGGQSAHEAGRELLAEMYREATGQALPEILLTERGKPYFADSVWHFSISHTKNHVFCALAEQPVGIDAEEIDRDANLRLADKILSAKERQYYDAAGDKRQALLRLWVLKESYAKLSGRGFGDYLYETEFSPDDPRIQRLHGCFVAVIENENL
jgi:phosphopantetheinyl transferase